jgi:hypothetical protein
LTEECSAAILNTSLIKKKDPGCPTIECSIWNQYFNNALCDLGASVSVMPKVVFDKLKHPTLIPTSMCLQLADQSVRYPSGIVENVPVKIREFLVPVDLWYWICTQTLGFHWFLGDHSWAPPMQASM